MTALEAERDALKMDIAINPDDGKQAAVEALNVKIEAALADGPQKLLKRPCLMLLTNKDDKCEGFFGEVFNFRDVTIEDVEHKFLKVTDTVFLDGLYIEWNEGLTE